MPKLAQPCVVSDCGGKRYRQGYCNRHFQRIKHHGHIGLVRETQPYDAGALLGSPTALTLKRFWAKVDIQGLDECWPWTGAKHKKKKYGFYWFIMGRSVSAHRLAWIIENKRPIPPGMEVMHSCDNPPCCNPAHLSIGTHTENMRDMSEKGRGRKPQRYH